MRVELIGGPLDGETHVYLPESTEYLVVGRSSGDQTIPPDTRTALRIARYQIDPSTHTAAWMGDG